MYSRQIRAGPAPTSSTASSQRASRFATQCRSVLRVVLAQRLDVADLEAGFLHDRDDAADLVQLAVGEHVAVDEAAATRSAARAYRRPADG